MTRDRSVLIVDDDDHIAEALSDALDDEGYSTARAEDGVDALEQLRAGLAPRVILLDWMMPRCDGGTFRREQIADPALAAIPVVLLTADARVSQFEEFGFAEVMRKPVRIDQLLDVLARFCPPA